MVMTLEDFSRLLYRTSAGCAQTDALAEYRKLLSKRAALESALADARREVERMRAFVRGPGDALTETMRERDEQRARAEKAARDRQVLLDAAEAALPEGEHPKDPTPDNWAWQIIQLGSDRRAAYRLLDEARAELARKGGGR